MLTQCCRCRFEPESSVWQLSLIARGMSRRRFHSGLLFQSPLVQNVECKSRFDAVLRGEVGFQKQTLSHSPASGSVGLRRIDEQEGQQEKSIGKSD
jgi:hypothetical protein